MHISSRSMFIRKLKVMWAHVGKDIKKASAFKFAIALSKDEPMTVNKDAMANIS